MIQDKERRLMLLFLNGIFLTSFSWALQKQLTFEQAYYRAGPRLISELPKIEKWLNDQYYLATRTPGSHSLNGLVTVNAATGQETLLLDFTALNKELPKGLQMDRAVDNTPDYSRYLFSHENDLFCFSSESKLYQQLTFTPEEEKTPHFSPDGNWVAFTRENDLYTLDIQSGKEHRITHDGSKTIYNGWASWVYYEEVFGRGSHYCTFWWSPDSKMLAFMRFDDTLVPEFPLYKADGIHGELEVQHYPKPGDPNPKVRLGVSFIENDQVVWIDTDENADEYIAWPLWAPDSKQLYFQWMNRGQDHLKIYRANPVTGKKMQIFEETDAAWVNFYEDLYLLKDGSGLLLRSSADGWPHLYYYDLKGSLKKRLTSGEWAVKNIVHVDEKNRVIYFHAAKSASTDQHLYRIDLNGRDLKQLTQAAGNHDCVVSINGSYFIDTFNNIQTPKKMEMYSGIGELMRTLGDSRLPVMDEYALGKGELFTIPSTDGFNLPALWILPPDFNSGKKYPVIISIYGGPDSKSVTNTFRRWGDYFLAQNGIIVLAVDHRGSGHFGKKGVVLMHRCLGKWEMHDYIEAVKWLRCQPFIDTNRIGITGGSYGGFATCMALTFGADYFTHGIAEYSVTDYRLYDSIYTERYMDLPDENPEGYAFTSIANHAEKLTGKLLIIHGTMDDNVHMQNILQTIEKLQDLNKNFELMIYPNARHGVRPPKDRHAANERVQFWFRHFFGREF